MKNKIKITLATTILVVLMLGIGFVSAAEAHDFSIRTSDENSNGTGIAINEISSGFWVSETTPELYINESYQIKYYVDNNVDVEDEAHIIVKLNNQVLRDYQISINHSTSKVIPLDISYLECNSTNFISLEVQPVYGEDLNMYDNLAQRSFRVSCENLPESICGNNIVEFREECDLGDSLQGCNPAYGNTCEYCSNECKLVEIIGSYCGDDSRDLQYEQCDDGNNVNGDGCDGECDIEVANGGALTINIETEDFIPQVWQCGGRVVLDDSVEPGRPIERCELERTTGTSINPPQCFNNQILFERINNYAFEGEQIQWRVLVMDKNGIEKIRDVYGSLDGNIEVNCDYLGPAQSVDDSCNARILEEELSGDLSQVAAYYVCTLTVETPLSMYGEYVLTVEAEDLDGEIGVMAESEYWFLNPEIASGIYGGLVFEDVRPGTSSYSDMVRVTNLADDGSGVMLDMFISGTDFYDSTSSGAMCGTSNQLELKNFAYYTVNGAYSSRDDGRSDAEGYIPINYGIGFNNPNPFYNNNEILQTQQVGAYYTANLLAPRADLAMTFRLNLPEPCNGDFDSGQIYFWGEAI